MSVLKIHIATPGDIPLIQSMAQNVFRKTYADLISSEQMEFMPDMLRLNVRVIRKAAVPSSEAVSSTAVSRPGIWKRAV